MKILYDHQTFSLQRYGGISRYFANLYQQINTKDGYECELAIFYSRNCYINARRILAPSLAEILLKKDKKLYKWNGKYSERKINRNSFDVFHPTYYDPYFLNTIKKPFVVTVHDMIHELYPEWFPGNDPCARNKRMLIERANHIIAISESTKKDLLSIYNIEEERISVIHHGYYFEEPKAVEFTLPFVNYILYVGDRGVYKNFYRFIQAVTPLFQKYPDLSVICAGGGHFNLAEQELFFRNRISRIIQIPANDQELQLLYSHASAFVFPSLYEGFGLPLLEAFANKCPVVSSNTSCFREVGGDACVYFNPNDAEHISNAIETVLTSKSLADNLKREGENQLRNFSIDTCIDKTAEVYRLVK